MRPLMRPNAINFSVVFIISSSVFLNTTQSLTTFLILKSIGNNTSPYFNFDLNSKL